MNGEQVRLVRDSFRQITPMADAAAKLFYGRLFDLDPALESLFRGDIKEQGNKLMQTIGLAIESSDRPERFLPAARALSARYAPYRVREKDYETVRRALMWTLRQGLGAAFTPEVEAAWCELYAELAAATRVGSAGAAWADSHAYVYLA